MKILFKLSIHDLTVTREIGNRFTVSLLFIAIIIILLPAEILKYAISNNTPSQLCDAEIHRGKKWKKNPVQPPLFYIQIMETDYEMKNNSHSVNDYSRVRRQC